MKNHAPDDRRLSKALALLDPPPADRDRVAKKIQSVLDDCSGKDHDELDFERNSAGLTRYINALRELKASHAALDPSIHRFLTLGVKYPSRWLGEVSDIEAELREAEIMLEICRRPSGQPTNKRARSAVIWAHVVLEGEGLEVTTERKGKWHLLSQIFADTSRDLRHHLTAQPAALQRARAEADDEDTASPGGEEGIQGVRRLFDWRKTQKR
jgi:hypothetical protein